MSSENARSGPRTASGGYSKTLDSLVAVWQVLLAHSSKEKPLSVKEIHELLKKYAETPPSISTIQRLLEGGQDAFGALFPGAALQQTGAALSNAAQSADGLSLRVTDRDGGVLFEGTVEGRDGSLPSYSAVDQLLQSLTAESALFPLRLKCVYARQDALGKTVYADYAKHESKLDESGRTSASGRRPNNQARLYYLDSVLSPAEWKLFSISSRSTPTSPRSRQSATCRRCRPSAARRAAPPCIQVRPPSPSVPCARTITCTCSSGTPRKSTCCTRRSNGWMPTRAGSASAMPTALPAWPRCCPRRHGGGSS